MPSIVEKIWQQGSMMLSISKSTFQSVFWLPNLWYPGDRQLLHLQPHIEWCGVSALCCIHRAFSDQCLFYISGWYAYKAWKQNGFIEDLSSSCHPFTFNRSSLYNSSSTYFSWPMSVVLAPFFTISSLSTHSFAIFVLGWKCLLVL